MQCVADGETALKDSFWDAFPHAQFTNDFYNAISISAIHALYRSHGNDG